MITENNVHLLSHAEALQIKIGLLADQLHNLQSELRSLETEIAHVLVGHVGSNKDT